MRQAVISDLISELTPQIENARELVQICQIDENPVPILEAGIALLFISHKSVLAATKVERVRRSLLPPIHEGFLSRFGPIATQGSMSEQRVLELLVRRHAAYDSLMDSNVSDWQYRLSEQLYESISGKRSDTAVLVAVGIAFLSRLNATSKFLREVCSKWV